MDRNLSTLTKWLALALFCFGYCWHGCRWVCNEPENLLDQCYIKCVCYIWWLFSGAWWPLGWVKFHTCMYIIELNKSNIHTYLFTAVLSKGTRKLLKYSYNIVTWWELTLCNLPTEINGVSIWHKRISLPPEQAWGPFPAALLACCHQAKQAKRSTS